MVALPTFPCLAFICLCRTYLQRTLPGVTSQDESFMLFTDGYISESVKFVLRSEVCNCKKKKHFRVYGTSLIVHKRTEELVIEYITLGSWVSPTVLRLKQRQRGQRVVSASTGIAFGLALPFKVSNPCLCQVVLWSSLL